MHPAGRVELTHGGVDNGDAGTPFLPCIKMVSGRVPLQRLRFRFEGPVHTDPRIVIQDVDVEIPPGDLVDPGDQSLLIASSALGLPCCKQALATRQYAVGQVRRELTGAIHGGKIPLLLVGSSPGFKKAFQLVVRGIFAGFYQGGRCLPEWGGNGVDLAGTDGIAAGRGRRKSRGCGFVNPAPPAPREGCEHRIGLVLLRQDLANWRDRLVPVLADG